MIKNSCGAFHYRANMKVDAEWLLDLISWEHRLASRQVAFSKSIIRIEPWPDTLFVHLHEKFQARLAILTKQLGCTEEGAVDPEDYEEAMKDLAHEKAEWDDQRRARQHSQRGGQNLSERYIRLEKSLRGKEALETEYEDLHRSTLTGPSLTRKQLADGQPRDTFRGIIIPEKPKEPQSDECCMSGCAICVYDLYEDSLSAYREAIAKVTASLNSMGVPESDWPQSLRMCLTAAENESKKDVTLSVFEQMELKIQQRKQETLNP
ncbi:oxidoreductase-like protein [Lentinula aciculospora]|uniref:Oxidoreductase-like protein n=1 Tax=Lentinula aciculospora TaxID=153920 RepID=A0A9W9ANQ3_9AGAR|nr:oxidoreductase-like protein [Lentinula aciculospora]